MQGIYNKGEIKMSKRVIYVADMFKDEVEPVDRAFLVNEMLYFLIDFDGIPKDEAVQQIMEMTDESLADNVNKFYKGSGTIYKVKK